MKLEGYRWDWAESAPLASAVLTHHEVVFAVKQATEELTPTLISVSDPASTKFGKHFDFAAIGELTANRAATAAVESYLRETGAKILRTTPHGEYVRATAPLAVWNELLAADFKTFQHVESGRTVARTRDYTVPAEIAAHVAFVGYTTELPPSRGASFVAEPTPSVGGVDPALLHSFYDIGTATCGTGTLSTIAVFEGDDQNYSPNDLAGFQSLNMLPAQPVAKVVGGHNSSTICQQNPQACGEADLDVQYAMAVAQECPMTYFYINNDTSPFVAWAEAVAAEVDPAKVSSISYGEIEQNMYASSRSDAPTLPSLARTRALFLIRSSLLRSAAPPPRRAQGHRLA